MKESTQAYFVTGIGTDVGKTVVAAILSESLRSYYWKPIQSGSDDGTDSNTIQSLCSDFVKIIPELYCFKAPVSPHLAAEMENSEIDVEQLVLPNVSGNLIVEGAGGLLVPITKKVLLIELIEKLNIPVILVSKHYLGSINHTLLSINALRQRSIPIKGVIFVGDENPDTEQQIQSFGNVQMLGRIPIVDELTPEFIREQALTLSELNLI
jgi:dethiobiotin synthetase